MFSKLNRVSTCIIAIILFVSCGSNEIGQSRDVNPEAIYQFYQFDYNENDKEAVLFAQFRFAGEKGTTLVLNPPSKLEYNGEVLKIDSSDFSGAFYRTTVSPQRVSGKHTLAFTDINNKKYENSFTVDSFMLLDVPHKISRLVPAQIKFTSAQLSGEDYIELSSEGTDSSFTIQYKATQKENYIVIPKEELQRQRKDEFFIVAVLHRKLSLQQQTKEGGAITIRQTIKPIKIRLVDEAL